MDYREGEEVEAIRFEEGPRPEDRDPAPGQGETPVRPNHCLEAEKPELGSLIRGSSMSPYEIT